MINFEAVRKNVIETGFDYIQYFLQESWYGIGKV